MADMLYYERPGRRREPAPRRTQSTREEESRILNWNYDVFASEMASQHPRHTGRPAHFSSDRTETLRPPLSRRATSPAYEAPSRQRPSIHSTSAATRRPPPGPAQRPTVTYHTIDADPDSSPHRRRESLTFQRRPAYPERLASDLPRPRASRALALEKSFERVKPSARLPSDSGDRLQPQYVARYRPAGYAADERLDAEPVPRGRPFPARPRTASSSSVRSRSEDAFARGRMLGREYDDARGWATPTRGEYSRTRAPVVVTPSPLGVARASSVTRTPAAYRPSPRDTPRPRIEAETFASPRARLGASRKASYSTRPSYPPPSRGFVADLDDDLDSIAPDDSISCVGSRGTGGRRHR